jgi:hypothetical protein
MDGGWRGSKINFLFLDKVFTTSESSGDFIFCLNDVLILTFFVCYLGVGGKIVLFLVKLSFATSSSFLWHPIFFFNFL